VEQQGVRQRRTMPAEVGQMLGRARMRAGWRGRECARLAGIDQSYLVRLESGQRAPSRVIAEGLAELLHLDDNERAMLLAAAVDDAGRGYWRGQQEARNQAFRMMP